MSESFLNTPFVPQVATAVGAEPATVQAKGKPGGVVSRKLLRAVSLMRPRGLSGLRGLYVLALIVSDLVMLRLAFVLAYRMRLLGDARPVTVISHTRLLEEPGLAACGVGPVRNLVSGTWVGYIPQPTFLTEILEWTLPFSSRPSSSPANTGSLAGQAISPASPRRANRAAGSPPGRTPLPSRCARNVS